jgi:hypothetical protein
MAEKGDFEWEIRYNLEAPYRFKTPTQVIIYSVIVLAIIFVAILVPLPSYLVDDITPRLVIVLFFATILWTIIVKDRSPLFKQVGNGLLLATVLPSITYIFITSFINTTIINRNDLILETFSLTLATILIFVMSIYGHVNPGFPSNRQFLQISILVSGALFFFCMIIFLWTYGPLFSFGAAVILTLVYIYAIYPEPED